MTSDGHPNIEAVAKARSVVRPSLLERFSKLFKTGSDCVLVTPTSEQVALTANIRIAWQDQPFALSLGRVALEFHPDLPITGNSADGSWEWIIHAGEAFYLGVPRYIRIRPGETVLLGRTDATQTSIFEFDGSVAGRHAKISNRKGNLTIEPLEPDRSTSIKTIDSPTALWAVRRDNLMRLPDVIGQELTTFNDDEALDIIRDINGILAAEAYRELDDDDVPGGIIQFPDDKTVLILGDVHTCANNVLSALAQGGTLAALECGEACLVFLGDLVHCEESGELDQMDSSVFILDLFCMLKRRFPDGVFYIHGNHESFSPDVGKGGVPQGMLLRKHLKRRRGKNYLAEVETLFSRLAFIVAGNDFAACHGGPVRSKVNRNTLVNMARYPGIQHELVWNRIRQGNRPGGYGKGSVKRFRQILNVSKQAPVIVGHTPQSSKETMWLNVGGIAGHHIIYSAHTDRAAAVVMSKGVAMPFEFIPDPALSFLNKPAEG